MPALFSSCQHKIEKKFPYPWDLNIYRGCSHRCQYCFAQYTHAYIGRQDYFGEIYWKENIAELLEKERETAGILFISHDVAALCALCGTVYVMEHGMLTEHGTMQELLEHPKQAWTKEYAAANHPVSREGWTWTD